MPALTLPRWFRRDGLGVSARRAWVLFLPLLAVLCLRARAFDYIVDDAYISLRYARNLVNHRELAFNVGERVEGVTNLLWTALLAVPEILGVSAEAFARLAGVVAAAGVVTLTVALGARRGILSLREACIPGLFLAALAPLPLWAQSGMETALFSLLFLAMFWVGERLERRADGIWLGTLGGVAFAVRPEGALALVMILGLGFITRRAARPAAICAVLTFATLATALTAFRLTYFGAWVPNTFAAKRSSLPILLRDGLEYGFAFGWRYLALPALALAWLGWRHGRLRALAARAVRHPFLICSALFGLYVIQAGGDWMPFARFFVPLLPLLLLAAAELAKSLDFGFESPRGLALVATLLVSLLGLEFVGADAASLRYNRDELRPALELVAEGLNEREDRDSIALTVAGLVPYRTGLPTLDLLGLNDRTIAASAPVAERSLPGHHKMLPGYVLDERKPGWLFINVASSVSPERLEHLPAWALEQRLTLHPSFARHYALATFPTRDRYVHAYKRRSN